MSNYNDVLTEKRNILNTLDFDIPMYKLFLKRVFDIFFSLLGLVVLSPLLLIVAVWIKLSTREKIFYKQVRMGQNLRLFEIYKFQTMVPDADKMGPLVTVGEDPRVTKPGKFLRKYKIDELPQLFNVLKGDMSFVGPRPEVPKYLPYYTNEQLKLFKIKPGITDYASIEFRDEEEYLSENQDKPNFYEEVLLPRKLRYSLRYLTNYSIIKDITIILLTILSVIFE